MQEQAIFREFISLAAAEKQDSEMDEGRSPTSPGSEQPTSSPEYEYDEDSDDEEMNECKKINMELARAQCLADGYRDGAFTLEEVMERAFDTQELVLIGGFLGLSLPPKAAAKRRGRRRGYAS